MTICPERLISFLKNDLHRQVIYALDNNNNSGGSLGVGFRLCRSAGWRAYSHFVSNCGDRADRATGQGSRYVICSGS